MRFVKVKLMSGRYNPVPLGLIMTVYTAPAQQVIMTVSPVSFKFYT